jgi:hypothetical protein
MPSWLYDFYSHSGINRSTLRSSLASEPTTTSDLYALAIRTYLL